MTLVKLEGGNNSAAEFHFGVAVDEDALGELEVANARLERELARLVVVNDELEDKLTALRRNYEKARALLNEAEFRLQQLRDSIEKERRYYTLPQPPPSGPPQWFRGGANVDLLKGVRELTVKEIELIKTWGGRGV